MSQTLNAHVQPTLNAFAVTLINCRVAVKTEDGDAWQMAEKTL